jgi:hypothetical protein
MCLPRQRISEREHCRYARGSESSTAKAKRRCNEPGRSACAEELCFHVHLLNTRRVELEAHLVVAYLRRFRQSTIRLALRNSKYDKQGPSMMVVSVPAPISPDIALIMSRARAWEPLGQGALSRVSVGCHTRVAQNAPREITRPINEVRKAKASLCNHYYCCNGFLCVVAC